MEINRYFIYKFMKWVKMFYCIFFFSLLIIDLSATGIVFAPPSFQRYMIYDESMETFLYKMERLCNTESSLSHYKTKDGFVKHVDTTPFVIYDSSGIAYSVGDIVMYLFLSDVNTEIRLTFPRRIDGLAVDLDIVGENKLPAKDNDGMLGPGRDIFEYGSSWNEMKKDMAVCRSFERNVLSKICEYRKNRYIVPLQWIGYWFEGHFKLLWWMLVSILVLAHMAKKFYYNSTYPNI